VERHAEETFQPRESDGIAAEWHDEIWRILLAVREDLERGLREGELGRFPFGAKIGGALLNRYLFSICPEPLFRKSSDKFVESLLGNAQRRPLYSLYGGVVGIAWLLSHLAHLDDGEPRIGAVDRVLLAGLAKSWKSVYDLIDGLVGIGLYSLERLPASEGRQILDLVVQRLGDLADERTGAKTWFTPVESIPREQREKFPRGYYNLGMAHGIPGVIRLFAEAVRADVNAETAQRMLESTVPWLLGKIVKQGDDQFLRGYVEGDPLPRRRLAWCYNELGAMTAIIIAGKICGHSEWIDRAAEVLTTTVGTPLDLSGARDASLCHGTAGIAHIYQWLGYELDSGAFREESRRWFEITVKMREEGRYSGGYFYISMDPETKERIRTTNHTFLEGGPGIGLALLSAAWNVLPGWNRLLGLS
jgi:hypothetical protein